MATFSGNSACTAAIVTASLRHNSVTCNRVPYAGKLTAPLGKVCAVCMTTLANVIHSKYLPPNYAQNYRNHSHLPVQRNLRKTTRFAGFQATSITHFEKQARLINRTSNAIEGVVPVLDRMKCVAYVELCEVLFDLKHFRAFRASAQATVDSAIGTPCYDLSSKP